MTNPAGVVLCVYPDGSVTTVLSVRYDTRGPVEVIVDYPVHHTGKRITRTYTRDTEDGALWRSDTNMRWTYDEKHSTEAPRWTIREAVAAWSKAKVMEVTLG